jgi:hypothetical protein
MAEEDLGSPGPPEGKEGPEAGGDRGGRGVGAGPRVGRGVGAQEEVFGPEEAATRAQDAPSGGVGDLGKKGGGGAGRQRGSGRDGGAMMHGAEMDDRVGHEEIERARISWAAGRVEARAVGVAATPLAPAPRRGAGDGVWEALGAGAG